MNLNQEELEQKDNRITMTEHGSGRVYNRGEWALVLAPIRLQEFWDRYGIEA